MSAETAALLRESVAALDDRALPRGHYVRLSVSDEGGGIPEEDLGRVFHPGWRGAQARTPVGDGTSSGAGLGLAIVHGIVEAHAGGVSVVNVPGGCRFDVVLPRGEAA